MLRVACGGGDVSVHVVAGDDITRDIHCRLSVLGVQHTGLSLQAGLALVAEREWRGRRCRGGQRLLHEHGGGAEAYEVGRAVVREARGEVLGTAV